MYYMKNYKKFEKIKKNWIEYKKYNKNDINRKISFIYGK